MGTNGFFGMSGDSDDDDLYGADLIDFDTYDVLVNINETWYVTPILDGVAEDVGMSKVEIVGGYVSSHIGEHRATIKQCASRISGKTVFLSAFDNPQVGVVSIMHRGELDLYIMAPKEYAAVLRAINNGDDAIVIDSIRIPIGDE